MNFNKLWTDYQRKAKDIRPFLRTKNGVILSILAVVDFIVLFFAPMLHGFVGTAIFGCVGSVFLILIWRKFDQEHVIVPAVILCIPMLLDMVIYLNLSVAAGCLVAMIATLLAARSSIFGFFDKTTDLLTSLLVAGGICVGVVVVACLALILINIAWWILCIIAFIVVVAVFLGVVFSTAAYTASDGRRQARKKHLSEEDADAIPDEDPEEQRYRDYQPRRRDTKIYNLDEDDFRDISE